MSMSVEAGTATDTAGEAEKDPPSNTPEKTLTIFGLKDKLCVFYPGFSLW